MHRSSILLGAMLHAVNAMDIGHAAPRDRVREAPVATITAAPFGLIDELNLLSGHHGLRPRQAADSSNVNIVVTVAPDKTCGYMSGNAGVPITCDNGRSCSWAATSGVGLVACGQEIYITCVESAKALDPKQCDDVCQSGTYNLFCTNSDAPYCRTYAFEDGVFDYRCASTSVKAVQSVSFTYDGQKNAKLITTTVVDGISSAALETSATDSDSESSADTVETTTTTASSDPVETHKSKSTPIGAIVGGVVGGVALIGLIGIGVFCLLRRRKSKPAANAAPATQPAMTQNPPPPQQMAMGQNPYPYQPHQPHPPPQQMVGSPYPDPSMATSPAPSDAHVSMMSGPVSSYGHGPASPMGWNQHQAPSPHPTPAPAYEMAGPEAREPEQVYEMGGDSSAKK